MINAKMWYDEDKVLWFEVSGHSSPALGDTERLQVCAGVSALMMALWTLCEHDGVWHGEGSGYIRVRVEDMYAAWATYAFTGIQLIARNYPGHIEFEMDLDDEEEGTCPTSLRFQ